MTPALVPQLGLLGSPPDPVGRFSMREGPSGFIVTRLQTVFARPRMFRSSNTAHGGCRAALVRARVGTWQGWRLAARAGDLHAGDSSRPARQAGWKFRWTWPVRAPSLRNEHVAAWFEWQTAFVAKLGFHCVNRGVPAWRSAIQVQGAPQS